MTRLVLVLGLAVAGLTGIGLLAARPAVAGERPVTVAVPGWITVTVPAGFTASETDRGLLIRQDGGLRTPLEVEILRRQIRTFIVTTETRQTPAGPVTWTITKRPAEGSGGAEWMLWVRHPAGWVLARKQREDGQPDFAPAWQIVDGIRPAFGE